MARLAAKPHLVASLNIMLVTREKRGGEKFTQEEVIEILSAMAETDAMTTNPPTAQPVHWQNAPSRTV